MIPFAYPRPFAIKPADNPEAGTEIGWVTLNSIDGDLGVSEATRLLWTLQNLTISSTFTIRVTGRFGTVQDEVFNVATNPATNGAVILGEPRNRCGDPLYSVLDLYLGADIAFKIYNRLGQFYLDPYSSSPASRIITIDGVMAQVGGSVTTGYNSILGYTSLFGYNIPYFAGGSASFFSYHPSQSSSFLSASVSASSSFYT